MEHVRVSQEIQVGLKSHQNGFTYYLLDSQCGIHPTKVKSITHPLEISKNVQSPIYYNIIIIYYIIIVHIILLPA